MINAVFADTPSCAQIVRRAFELFASFPCLGELIQTGANGWTVRWRSFGEIGLAVQRLAKALRAVGTPDSAIVAMCAPNSVGWLVADFACVVAHLPTACVDDTLTVVDAAIAAFDAAAAVGREVQLAFVDGAAADAWSAELGLSAQLRPQPADQMMLLDGLVLLAGGASPVGRAASFSSLADVRIAPPPANSLSSSSSSSGRCSDGGVPLTALFTSGSTGIPKPRWMSEANWAQRTPKGTSVRRVTAVPVFSPLSHGL